MLGWGLDLRFQGNTSARWSGWSLLVSGGPLCGQGLMALHPLTPHLFVEGRRPSAVLGKLQTAAQVGALLQGVG